MAARRAVVLAHNTLNTYSRGVRFARSLAEAGWDVTLAGLAAEGLPVAEPLGADARAGSSAEAESAPAESGELELRRIAPQGLFTRFLHPPHGRLDVGARSGLGVAAGLVRVVGWPLAPRAWERGLRDLPPADLYHACGIGAGIAARSLARRARRAGRAGAVIYDYIDIFQESDPWYALPPWRRRLYPRREAAIVRSADAIVSVSEHYAADAVGRFGLGASPLVVYNCPPRTEIAAEDTDLVRRATGLPPERGVVLFLGRFVPFRGILEAGDAVLALRDAAFVAMGYGPLRPVLRARDAEPRRQGRHFTLPPVPPGDVARWAAGADATIFISPGRNLNHRLMTPNKLWESLAGGAPVLLGSDNLAAREIAEPLGLAKAVPDDDPATIARALREFLDEQPAERAARRARARKLVAERYSWDVRIGAYRSLVDELVPAPGVRGKRESGAEQHGAGVSAREQRRLG